MNNARKKTIRRIKAIIAEVEPKLDLPGVIVEHRFHQTTLDPESGDTTAAVTKCATSYRWAILHWYLPNLVGSSWKDLGSIVIHEYCHILNAPMAALLGDEGEQANAVEAATENMARALLKAVDWSWQK